jgi:hypothetical protein
MKQIISQVRVGNAPRVRALRRRGFVGLGKVIHRL